MKTDRIEVRHCFECPFCCEETDYNSVGSEYYYTCNLLKREENVADYVIGVFSDEIFEKENDELFPQKVLDNCPLKNKAVLIDLNLE